MVGGADRRVGPSVLAGVHMPEHGGLVLRGCREELVVRGEGDAHDAVAVARQDEDRGEVVRDEVHPHLREREQRTIVIVTSLWETVGRSRSFGSRCSRICERATDVLLLENGWRRGHCDRSRSDGGGELRRGSVMCTAAAASRRPLHRTRTT